MRIVRLIVLGSVLAFCLVTQKAHAESLTVHFIDVGMGNATLLHQPGKCAMLVDSGPSGSSVRLLEILRDAGVHALDFVVITQPQVEQFGGLAGVASKVKILELSDNGDMNEAEEGFDAYSRLQFTLPYSVLAKGDSWRCGDLGIEVVHPSASYDSGDDYRGRSLVLRISYNSFRMLLLGHVSAAGERKMLQSEQDLDSMVLRVVNRGGEEGLTPALLDRVEPRIAIVNGALKPGGDLADRLAERTIRAFSVDEEGTIQLRVAENGNIRLKP